MTAKITAVIKLKGILATHWEFDFTVESNEQKAMEGTVSLDDAVCFAKRAELGPIAEMCREIKATPAIEYQRLVGRTF